MAAHRSPVFRITGIVILACSAVLPGSGLAESASDKDLDAWRYELSVVSFHAPETSLDGGGETQFSSYHLQARARRRIARGVSANLTLNYGYFDEKFSGGGFGALQPWDDTQRFGLSTRFLIHSSEKWSWGIRPFASSFSESGNINSDTLRFGIAVAAISHWSPARHLGVGIKLTNRLDDTTKVVPFLAVSWRLNDYWRLRNPSEPELVGATGLELAYTPESHWRLSALGMFLSSEFRLDNDGLAPGGLGQREGAVGLLSLNRHWSSGLSLKGYVGVLSNGTLEVRDAADRLIARSDYDTTPLIGLALEKRL